MEYVLVAYAEGSMSLREVVWSLAGDRTPSHSTLHAWSEALGAYVLGREAGEVAGGTPHTALIQETEARVPEALDVAQPAVAAAS